MKRRANFQWFIFLVLFTSFLFSQPFVSYAETDVTSKIELVKSSLMYDRRAGTSYFDVYLRNISQNILLTPIKVVIESISPAGVAVTNADGTTSDGKPYFSYTSSPSLLQPAGSINSKRWIFSNPQRLRFNYTARVWQTDFQDGVGAVQEVTPEQIVTDTDTGIKYVSGQVLVTAADGVTRDQINQLITSLGGAIVGYTRFVEIYQVIFSNMDLAGLEAAIGQLKQSSMVQSAIINEVHSLNAPPNPARIPNDLWGGTPNNPTSWEVYPWEDGIIENRVPKGANWAMESMRFPEAWHAAYGNMQLTEIPSIKVGIVDSDFPVEIDGNFNVTRSLHEDLQTIVWANKKGDKEVPSGLPLDDSYKHGHLVAGIIGANANNDGVGVTGAVWNAQLYGHKSGPVSDILYGIANLILNKKVGVVNLSIGRTWKEPDRLKLKAWSDSDRKKYVEEERAFFTSFFRRLQDTKIDFLVVQAAGNDGIDSSFLSYAGPITDPDVRKNLLVVGSYDVNFQGRIGYDDQPLYERTKDCVRYAWCSNYGPQVDIYGPGGYLNSNKDWTIYSTMYDYTQGEMYGYSPRGGGSSFAAPHITGLAALIKQRYPSRLTWSQVREAIITGTYAGIQINENKEIYIQDGSLAVHPILLRIADAKRAMDKAGDLASGLPISPDNPVFEGSAILFGTVSLLDAYGNKLPDETLANYNLSIVIQRGTNGLPIVVNDTNILTHPGEESATFWTNIPLLPGETSANVNLTFSLIPKVANAVRYHEVRKSVSVDSNLQNFVEALQFIPIISTLYTPRFTFLNELNDSPVSFHVVRIYDEITGTGGVPLVTVNGTGSSFFDIDTLKYGGYILEVEAAGFVGQSQSFYLMPMPGLPGVIRETTVRMTPITYSLSGRVTLEAAGLGGVSLVLDGGGTTITRTTDASGNYNFDAVPAGNYTLTPSLAGYLFNPTAKIFTLNENKTNENFAATKVNSISGRVISGGVGLEGVRIDLQGNGISTYAGTLADGSYTFVNIPNGSYTLTPSLQGYQFNPMSIQVAVSGTDITVANIVATGGPQIDLSAGLVAYFPFDGNANDASGNGNHGTIFGNPEIIQGINGTAFYFDGTNDYVSHDIGSQQTIAVSLWFNTPYPITEYPRLFDFGNQKDFECHIAGNNPTYINQGVVGQVRCVANVGPNPPANQYVIYSQVKPAFNQWHHLYALFDGANNILKLYIDGVLQGEVPTSGVLAATNMKFAYGSSFNTPEDTALLPQTYLKGALDEVRIYNRALSEAEIQDLFNQGSSLNVGLIAYYPFDGNAQDLSGNNNHGTAFGGVGYVSGVMGQAASFDGIDDFLRVPRSLRIQYPLTVSLWVKVSDKDGTFWSSDNRAASAIGYRYNSDNKFYFYILTSDNPYSGNPASFSSTVDVWHHVVWLYDGAMLKGYVDGNEAMGLQRTGSLLYGGFDDFTIGSYCSGVPCGSQFAFKGLVDEVRIYNRVLSEAEILALYSAPQ